MQLHPFAPKFEYQQNDSKSSCLISLESSLTVSGEFISARGIARRIEESLNCQYKGYYDRIKFASAVILDKGQKKIDQLIHYNIYQWRVN